MTNKTKPFEVISAQFQISRESAKYFLGRVQKSFKVQKPPQPLILDFMESQQYGQLPKPYDVARLMHEAGVWEHPLHAEPAQPEDEPDVYRD